MRTHVTNGWFLRVWSSVFLSRVLANLSETLSKSEIKNPPWKWNGWLSWAFHGDQRLACASISCISKSLPVHSCLSFNTPWWAQKCSALPTTLATPWLSTSWRPRRRMTTKRSPHGKTSVTPWSLTPASIKRMALFQLELKPLFN